MPNIPKTSQGHDFLKRSAISFFFCNFSSCCSAGLTAETELCGGSGATTESGMKGIGGGLIGDAGASGAGNELAGGDGRLGTGKAITGGFAVCC